MGEEEAAEELAVEGSATVKSPKDQRKQCCLTQKVVVWEQTCSGRIAMGCLRRASFEGMMARVLWESYVGGCNREVVQVERVVALIQKDRRAYLETRTSLPFRIPCTDAVPPL